MRTTEYRGARLNERTRLLRVPRYNFAADFTQMNSDIADTLTTMLRQGDYVLTPTVAEFEEAFARFVGTPYAVGVNSGTDALQLAFRGLGLSTGSTILTQANGFNATVAAIILAGATPVLVDADPETLLWNE